MAGRLAIQPWSPCIEIDPPRSSSACPAAEGAGEPEAPAELVLARLESADGGQLETLRRHLFELTRWRRCVWRGCAASTRKTPFCEEHLARAGFRIGPSTVCKGDGVFAVAQPEVLARAAAQGRRPDEVEVFGPTTRIFIMPYEGVLLVNPTPHELEELDRTAHWTYCFRIDSLTYLDAALESFLGRFVDCAYPDPSRANARFSSNTRKKGALLRAIKAIKHNMEILATSYGAGYFPRLLSVLEKRTLHRYGDRSAVERSERTKRVEGRSGGKASAAAPEGLGGAAPGPASGPTGLTPEDPLEPFPLGPYGEWWVKPPVIKAKPRSGATFGVTKRRRGPLGASVRRSLGRGRRTLGLAARWGVRIVEISAAAALKHAASVLGIGRGKSRRSPQATPPPALSPPATPPPALSPPAPAAEPSGPAPAECEISVPDLGLFGCWGITVVDAQVYTACPCPVPSDGFCYVDFRTL
eukprot:tig00021046_g17789.t1